MLKRKYDCMSDKEPIRVNDNRGFIYNVTIEYFPQYGFSQAITENGRIIGQVELNKLREPHSDDDREWEHYEEQLDYWRNEMKTNLIPICESHFNNKQL